MVATESTLDVSIVLPVHNEVGHLADEIDRISSSMEASPYSWELVLVDDVIIEELTPRNVHGYFTRLLAQRMGSDLIIDTSGTDSVRLSVALAG